MTHNNIKMTIAQFAKLHKVNKRTLHYYDNIGLFSPSAKGDNGYRYYDVSQSITFEYIRMLKEMNMSIEEIADYCKNPTADRFLKIADMKEAELDLEIQNLKCTKKILKAKETRYAFVKIYRSRKSELKNARQRKYPFCPMIFLMMIYHKFSSISKINGA